MTINLAHLHGILSTHQLMIVLLGNETKRLLYQVYCISCEVHQEIRLEPKEFLALIA
ncbi:protein of unknown function [Azospirillum lipoferum 4B]|uniref:Uncharacterized protein n=1 Tax=Azospirillum lipoferum (strain 4B) TaxID=862719 RepID=G7Z1T1_AZOL4|nr:protein of unknown function [Azospirillum lipoferum 4B]